MTTVKAFAIVLIAMAAPSLAQKEAAHSVVKITCRANGGEWVGSGFAWNQPTQVVTALHVVAGCAGIEVYSEGLKDGTSAKVRNVIIESDLALLDLAKPIGLEPVKTSGNAAPGKEYTIWGYPLRVRTMQGVELQIAKALKSPSALEDLMKPEEYKAAVGGAGYPALKAAILRVASTIQPGHSGAPIFDANGMVVGIGDGGLHEGIKGINWAIPTASLQAILSSKDRVPSTRPNQRAQFSAPAGEASAPIALPNGGALQYAFTASVEKIAATASAEEKEGMQEIIKEAAEDALREQAEEAKGSPEDGNAPDGRLAGEGAGDPSESTQAPSHDATASDLRKKLLDVFEDPATGATIAVPKGMKPNVEPGSGMLTASDAEGRVTLYVKVAKTGGAAALKQFEAFFNKSEKWKPDPDLSDDRFEEPGSLEIEKSRFVGDDPGNPDKSLTYSANLEEDRFLGTAIVAKDMHHLTEEDITNVHLMEMCVKLAGFRVD